MSLKTFKVVSVVALVFSAVALTNSVLWAKGNKKPSEGKSFKVTGIVKSVNQNSLTLEQKGKGKLLGLGHGKQQEAAFTIAQNATVKWGNESKPLSGLSTGMRVRLHGVIGADGARTVNEITVLHTKHEKAKNNPAPSAASAGQSRPKGRGY